VKSACTRRFPQRGLAFSIARTVRNRHDFENMLNKFHSGEINFVVGTADVAKGHDVHGVTLVGVVGADYALVFLTPRRRNETFQLLTQVAGRAGRGERQARWYCRLIILTTCDSICPAYMLYGLFEKEVRFSQVDAYPPSRARQRAGTRDKLEQTLRWTGQLGKWLIHAQ